MGGCSETWCFPKDFTLLILHDRTFEEHASAILLNPGKKCDEFKVNEQIRKRKKGKTVDWGKGEKKLYDNVSVEDKGRLSVRYRYQWMRGVLG
ncbi:hypothetical protein PAXRUDRAFT_667625 [Paxillus rubicundulus Ve08.2h10]|uniref:Uncharacterized protein n=1 Tax=Paxillus rubicundulus Ve08.2h10 TaxID=930991 RepID=A0A0D0DV79_9AGAM|nr:hypothetical protein PAXRUDRAFT_667625 [Paxillus rubicundulus Ve08.2h10]